MNIPVGRHLISHSRGDWYLYAHSQYLFNIMALLVKCDLYLFCISLGVNCGQFTSRSECSDQPVLALLSKPQILTLGDSVSNGCTKIPSVCEWVTQACQTNTSVNIFSGRYAVWVTARLLIFIFFFHWKRATASWKQRIWLTHILQIGNLGHKIVKFTQ